MKEIFEYYINFYKNTAVFMTKKDYMISSERDLYSHFIIRTICRIREVNKQNKRLWP